VFNPLKLFQCRETS